jgi:adenylate cyclase
MLRAAINTLIAGLFALHSLQWISIPGVRTLNNVTFDHLTRAAPRSNDVIRDIVIMDIDEASLSNEKLGRWPWSRNVLSNLIIQLFEEHEARVVAFDVVFSEADKSSGLEQLEKLAVGPLASDNAFRKKLEELTPTLQYDELFAEVLMQYPVVLGYYFNTEGSIRSGVLPLPTVLKEETKIQPGKIVKATAYGANIETLSDAAIASGHFNPIVDEDGLIRRVPLLIDFEGELYESLALATFRVAKAVEIARRDNGVFKVPALQLFDTAGKEILSTSQGTASPGAVQIAEKVIPTKDDGTIYVSYQGKARTFRYTSFNDLVNNKVDKEMLRDKIILVGTTAPGLSDFRSTPMGELYPGVEVHANALASMLSRDGLSVPTQLPEQKVLEIVALLVAAAFLITVLPRLSPLMSVAVWLVVVAVEAGATYHLWVKNHIVVSFGPLIAMTVFLFLWSFGYQFYSTFKNKNQFASLFGQYVPPELVKKMAEDPTKYSMQGKRALILFAAQGAH